MIFVELFCFQVEKYRPRLTSTVLTRENFINAIVASVSNFTNNKRGLKPFFTACRISICFVLEHHKNMIITDKFHASCLFAVLF